MDNLGFEFGNGRRFFCSQKCPDQFWGPLSHLFSGYQGSFDWVKPPEQEVDHSSSSSAEVKNEWNYLSTPVCLYGVDRDNFTFLSPNCSDDISIFLQWVVVYMCSLAKNPC
jgi:hypothetical protein